MRSEVWHDLATGHELVADALKAMGIHDGRHHLAIHGKRHVNEATLDQRRPVLIAHRMTELDAGAHRLFGRASCQLVQKHDQHIPQLDPRDDG